jgi:hypothetical protein
MESSVLTGQFYPVVSRLEGCSTYKIQTTWEKTSQDTGGSREDKTVFPLFLKAYDYYG